MSISRGLDRFLILGNRDPIIELSRSEKSAEIFQKMAFQRYIFKVYDGLEHSNNEQVS